MSTLKLVATATPSRDDRRPALKLLNSSARLLFVRHCPRLPNGRYDLALAASKCAASVDAVESWISGKRRVPGSALVGIGATVQLEAKRAA